MSRAKPPNITAVEVTADHVLRIHWREHGESTVDLTSLITTSRPLASIQSPAVFASVQVGEDGYACLRGL